MLNISSIYILIHGHGYCLHLVDQSLDMLFPDEVFLNVGIRITYIQIKAIKLKGRTNCFVSAVSPFSKKIYLHRTAQRCTTEDVEGPGGANGGRYIVPISPGTIPSRKGLNSSSRLLISPSALDNLQGMDSPLALLNDGIICGLAVHSS